MIQLRTLIAYLTLRPSAVAIEREDGQTLAEYALILALIAAVVAVVVATLGGTIGDLFNTIGDKI